MKYRVELTGLLDADRLPVTVEVEVGWSHREQFERMLESGTLEVGRACSSDGEFEI